jgi:hypothetical protein
MLLTCSKSPPTDLPRFYRNWRKAASDNKFCRWPISSCCVAMWMHRVDSMTPRKLTCHLHLLAESVLRPRH